METLYGYIRVSTKDQHEDRQLLALKEFGVEEKCIYMDKLSGKDFDRPQYQKLLRKMRPGAVLIIKSIDRLGRNYTEIQNQWWIITKEKGADLVLQILCYAAQVERENIKQRQAEGIAAAKAGGCFGREKMKIPEEFYPLQMLYRGGEITARAAARRLGVVHSTFLKWDREMEAYDFCK